MQDWGGEISLVCRTFAETDRNTYLTPLKCSLLKIKQKFKVLNLADEGLGGVIPRNIYTMSHDSWWVT